jgi:MFS family permease
MKGMAWLERDHTVAKPGFNRWLVPPAALAIHLCIGMAYGFSVFWLPLSRALGGETSRACPDMTLLKALTTASCDWRVSDLVWIYTLFFVVLGSAAALFGGWLERAGPRKAGLVATVCWCGGMVISAFGVATHQLWIMWLASGVMGGVGLGLGYISPVSTLIKWFPDKRGMATGMAIMGFGGGAMIGSPLADMLMKHFATPSDPGVWQTFLVMAAGYAVFMTAGSLGYRVPPDGWRPEGWTPPATTRLISTRSVHLKDAHKTPQFWLIWFVLLLNVSASIGIIGVASPMLQEVFAGKLIGQPGVGFLALDEDAKKAVASAGAGFVGLISLFNIGGRFFWASSSDRLGRKTTYAVMLALGAALYGLVAPWSAGVSLAVFIIAFCVIASMYGGGFSTVPAYLADIFGPHHVGAIHGRLLTAWSTAGVLGPFIVTTIRDRKIAEGAPRETIYGPIFLILAGLLVVGFLANLLIRPVDEKWLMADETKAAQAAEGGSGGIGSGSLAAAALPWLLVLIPIAWGVWMTLTKTAALFG